MGERLGKDISPIVIGVNLENLNSASEDVVTKMMIFDRQILGTRVVSIRGGNHQATLIVITLDLRVLENNQLPCRYI